LREHGYVVGQNLVLECRWTEGRDERAPALAAELVSLKPELIVADGTSQVRGVKQASSTIPIVMVGVLNPVERGLVASLAQPGRNVTGLSETIGTELMGKYFQLLKEVAPSVSRVAVLAYSNPQRPPTDRIIFQNQMEAAARVLGVTLQYYYVGDPQEFEGAFAAMTKAREEALLLLGHHLFANHAKRIVELAAKTRLPAVYPLRVLADAGGLMAYQANLPEMYRRIGFYVDKILHGANPGDLPVEQPTQFELIINLKTAKALGLTIPEPLLIRADEVIQ
jgi:putative ABC transport system substrate-binding protein